MDAPSRREPRFRTTMHWPDGAAVRSADGLKCLSVAVLSWVHLRRRRCHRLCVPCCVADDDERLNPPSSGRWLGKCGDHRQTNGVSVEVSEKRNVPL